MYVDDGICDCCDCSYDREPSFMERDEDASVASTWANQCTSVNMETVKEAALEREKSVIMETVKKLITAYETQVAPSVSIPG